MSNQVIIGIPGITARSPGPWFGRPDSALQLEWQMMIDDGSGWLAKVAYPVLSCLACVGLHLH